LRQTAHGINEGLGIRSNQRVEKVKPYRFYLVHGDLTYPNGLRKASHGAQTAPSDKKVGIRHSEPTDQSNARGLGR